MEKASALYKSRLGSGECKHVQDEQIVKSFYSQLQLKGGIYWQYNYKMHSEGALSILVKYPGAI